MKKGKKAYIRDNLTLQNLARLPPTLTYSEYKVLTLGPGQEGEVVKNARAHTPQEPPVQLVLGAGPWQDPVV